MTHVRRWLDGWSPRELGVCWEEDDQVVGAAWARRVEPILVRSALGPPVLEVLIAVDPARRGQGIGQTLMGGSRRMVGARAIKPYPLPEQPVGKINIPSITDKSTRSPAAVKPQATSTPSLGPFGRTERKDRVENNAAS